MKRNTIISAVAVEAPCICPFYLLFSGIILTSAIDVVSFLWLATGGYAEHRVELGGYFPWLDGAFNHPWQVSTRQN
jgi:hypothetical protein